MFGFLDDPNWGEQGLIQNVKILFAQKLSHFDVRDFDMISYKNKQNYHF